MSEHTNLGNAVEKVMTAMGGIDGIVKALYDQPEQMAEALKQFAVEDNHDVGWVAKKAHDVIRGIEWEQRHIPLNRALGLGDWFTG